MSEKKFIKASEYYSKRNTKDKTDDSILSELSAKKKEDEKKEIKRRDLGYSKGKSLNIKSPNIKSVSDNLKKAVEKADSKNKDEAKILTHRIIATEAVATGEIKTVGAVKNATGSVIGTTRYTVTRFSRTERERRNQYKSYYENKKEIKRLNKNINNWKKKEKTEKQPVIAKKYKMKQERAGGRVKVLKDRNNIVKRSMITKRHTRSVNIIKQNSLAGVKSVGTEIIKTPNRFMLMLSSDLDAEKMAVNGTFSIVGTFSKMFLGSIKLFLASVKSILIAISPLLFLAVIIIFMIYIIFFSDFESYFDLNIEKEDISGEITTDTHNMISAYMISKRNDMAREKVESDNTVHVYFVKLEDDIINEVISLMEEKSKELGTPSVLFDDWIYSDEATEILENIINEMYYWIPDEEIATYSDEQLEAYSENIIQPEQSGQETTEIKKAIIGYYPVNNEQQ